MPPDLTGLDDIFDGIVPKIDAMPDIDISRWTTKKKRTELVRLASRFHPDKSIGLKGKQRALCKNNHPYSRIAPVPPLMVGPELTG